MNNLSKWVAVDVPGDSSEQPDSIRVQSFPEIALALDPTWVKNHACYEELRTYGAIAA
jgi:hypothetical protein